MEASSESTNDCEQIFYPDHLAPALPPWCKIPLCRVGLWGPGDFFSQIPNPISGFHRLKLRATERSTQFQARDLVSRDESMAVPAILTVDDEPEVLRAVERDLRRKYGRDYRILGANSGSSAIELLQQLKTRGDSLALTVADQRMPQLSGLDAVFPPRQTRTAHRLR